VSGRVQHVPWQATSSGTKHGPHRLCRNVTLAAKGKKRNRPAAMWNRTSGRRTHTGGAPAHSRVPESREVEGGGGVPPTGGTYAFRRWTTGDRHVIVPRRHGRSLARVFTPGRRTGIRAKPPQAHGAPPTRHPPPGCGPHHPRHRLQVSRPATTRSQKIPPPPCQAGGNQRRHRPRFSPPAFCLVDKGIPMRKAR